MAHASMAGRPTANDAIRTIAVAACKRRDTRAITRPTSRPPWSSLVEVAVGDHGAHHAHVDLLGHVVGKLADLALDRGGTVRRVRGLETAVMVGETGLQGGKHPGL